MKQRLPRPCAFSNLDPHDPVPVDPPALDYVTRQAQGFTRSACTVAPRGHVASRDYVLSPHTVYIAGNFFFFQLENDFNSSTYRTRIAKSKSKTNK